MLDTAFLQALNMSFTASYVVLFVLLARLFLKKAPRVFSYSLWSVVLFRLLCPFSFESIFSIFSITGRDINDIRPFPAEFATASLTETNIQYTNSPVAITPPKNPRFEMIFTLIWLIGILAMLVYSIVAFVKLKRSLVGSIHLKDNIYLADHITSPFVMGLIKPKIYLPSSLSNSEKDFIIAHEKCHIKRFDHITRILGFVALSIHWFNPIVWVAFILSGKDMELSCDEAVMKKMKVDIRAEYSQSLLRFATGKKTFHATPLAFGEGDTKGRVKNVLNYKKPAFWIIVVSVIAVVAVGIVLVANPKEKPTGFAGVNAIILEIDKANLSITVKGTDLNSAIGDNCIVDLKEASLISVATNAELKSLFLDAFAIGDTVVLFIDEIQETYPTRAKATTVQLQEKAPLTDMRPMIMVDGALYLDTGKEESCNNIVWEGAILSAVSQTEKPVENAQSNFGFVGSRYIVDDKGLILETDEIGIGIRFEKETVADVKSGDDNLMYNPDSYSIANLKNGDIQLSINNTIEFSELGNKNEGYAYFEKATNQLHVGIITAFGQPKATDENPVGSLAGAKLEFDMDIKTGKLLNKATPYNSENVRFEISDEAISNIGKKLYKKILELSSVQNPNYNIMTVDNGPIGVPFKINKNNELDTLQMLAELDKSNNKFKAEMVMSDDKYIKFDFIGDKKLKSIYLRYIASVDDIWQKEYPIDKEYKIKLPTKTGIYSFFADIIWENGDSETAYFGITVGNPPPLPITKETAAEFINQALSTFKLNSDNTVSFTLPSVIPTDESGKTKLYISSSATFAPEPSTSSVQEILDWKDGWQGGDSYSKKLETEKGKLTRLFLRVAFMTENSENSYKEYAANYIELVEPFQFDKSETINNRSVEITEVGAATAIKYIQQNGDSFSITLTPPNDVALSIEADYPEYEMPTIVVNKNKAPIGTLTLLGFGTDDKNDLKQMNTSKNEMPMTIFSPIVLSNHAEFKNYKIVKSSATSANATAKYFWQDLADYEGRASEAPWLTSDSILAYDYEKMPFFINLNLADNSLSTQELENLAKSITITD